MNKDYTFECLDRVYSMGEIFQILVLNHPVIDNNSTLKASAEEIAEKLGDLYISIGQEVDNE